MSAPFWFMNAQGKIDSLKICLVPSSSRGTCFSYLLFATGSVYSATFGKQVNPSPIPVGFGYNGLDQSASRFSSVVKINGEQKDNAGDFCVLDLFRKRICAIKLRSVRIFDLPPHLIP
jgi:hypothetical protein